MYKYKGFIFKMVMSLYEIAYFQGKKAYLEEIMIKCGKCGSNQFNLKTYPQGNELMELIKGRHTLFATKMNIKSGN